MVYLTRNISFYIAITVCQEQTESPSTRMSRDPLIFTRLQLLWYMEMVSNEAEDRMAHSPEVLLHVLQKNTRELPDRQYHLLERTWMRQEPETQLCSQHYC